MTATVCSVDLGTSMIKATLVNATGGMVSSARAPAPEIDGSDACFDAAEYFDRTLDVLAELMRHCEAKPVIVKGFSISSQRASVVLIGQDDKPVGPALSWMGVSCAESAEAFYRNFGKERFHEITGLPPSAIYTVAKLVLLNERLGDAFSDSVRVVTLHDYVLKRLGATRWVTDHSNGSATGLYDIAQRGWSSEILDAIGLPVRKLPRIENAGTLAGALCSTAAKRTGITEGTPLFVGGGDQQCAVLGVGELKKGECILSLGTSAVAAVSFDSLPKDRPAGVLMLSHVIPDLWHAEGFMNAYGSVVEWASGVLCCNGPAGVERLAAKASDGPEGVIFVPHLAGIGTPDMSASATGSFSGLQLSTTREHLARAVFEGLAEEIGRVLKALGKVTPIECLKLVGGGRGKNLFSDLLTKVANVPVTCIPESQTAVLGAAALAWAGLGRYPDSRAAIHAFEMLNREREDD